MCLIKLILYLQFNLIMESMKTKTEKVTSKNVEKSTPALKESSEKKLSAFGKFMLENQGMIEIIDMKAVMR